VKKRKKELTVIPQSASGKHQEEKGESMEHSTPDPRQEGLFTDAMLKETRRSRTNISCLENKLTPLEGGENLQPFHSQEKPTRKNSEGISTIGCERKGKKPVSCFFEV